MPYKDPEKQKEYWKERSQRPEIIARRSELAQTPEGKAGKSKSDHKYYEKNKNKYRDYQREYSKRPKVQARKRASYLKNKARYLFRARLRTYGISKDEFFGQTEAQLGRCALCGGLLGDDVCVDHDHKTGKFRGLLHKKCNSGLGMFNDDLKKLQLAVIYLEGGT